LLWIVAGYVAPFAATITPHVGIDPLPHSRDPPAYGVGLVTVSVMVVLPEPIVNGIDKASVLDVQVYTETLTFALASVEVPGYGPVAGPAAVKLAFPVPVKHPPLPPPVNVVLVALSTSSWACAAVAAVAAPPAAIDIAVAAMASFLFPCICLPPGWVVRARQVICGVLFCG
jgi:hypothetical protein